MLMGDMYQKKDGTGLATPKEYIDSLLPHCYKYQVAMYHGRYEESLSELLFYSTTNHGGKMVNQFMGLVGAVIVKKLVEKGMI
jgi:hypothetical protein